MMVTPRNRLRSRPANTKNGLPRRALRLYEHLADLSREEQTAFLDSECQDEPELRERVERLIQAALDATNLLPTTAGGSAAQQSPLRLADGVVLNDRYEIIEIIGAGGMGEVYRALDTRLGRQVAIKTTNLANFLDEQIQSRFDREMKAAASLSHPNLVTLFDACCLARSRARPSPP